MGVTVLGIQHNFYPRSPCGERLREQFKYVVQCRFLSTLSLRRATNSSYGALEGASISIHALLAESDPVHFMRSWRIIIFLSTLSLRRATIFAVRPYDAPIFLSTLSLRRATVRQRRYRHPHYHFYPRSPCGERHVRIAHNPGPNYFYPRSPCGERPLGILARRLWYGISIHALLAESDIATKYSWGGFSISIHALLAESDDTQMQAAFKGPEISIHALLAESDTMVGAGTTTSPNFYPRSPCGERLPRWALKNIAIVFLSTLSLRRATARQIGQAENQSPFLSTLSLRRATANNRAHS